MDYVKRHRSSRESPMLFVVRSMAVESEAERNLADASDAMNPDEALTTLEAVLQPKCLNDVQQTVFCRAWIGQSYEEIAVDLAYDSGYSFSQSS